MWKHLHLMARHRWWQSWTTAVNVRFRYWTSHVQISKGGGGFSESAVHTRVDHMFCWASWNFPLWCRARICICELNHCHSTYVTEFTWKDESRCHELLEHGILKRVPLATFDYEEIMINRPVWLRFRGPGVEYSNPWNIACQVSLTLNYGSSELSNLIWLHSTRGRERGRVLGRTGQRSLGTQRDITPDTNAVIASNVSPIISRNGRRVSLSPFLASPRDRAWWNFDSLIQMMAYRFGYIVFLPEKMTSIIIMKKRVRKISIQNPDLVTRAVFRFCSWQELRECFECQKYGKLHKEWKGISHSGSRRLCDKMMSQRYIRGEQEARETFSVTDLHSTAH